jgi:hypothetical protein
MTRRKRKQAKAFTVDAANACLPLVRVIVADMVHLSRDVMERRQRLEMLTDGRDVSPGDPYSDELSHVQQELEKDITRLEGFADELSELGVILRSPQEGLVDFPARLDGRDIHLCWKFNEPEVLYWHELDAGYAGRQPLTAGSVSAEGDGGETDLLSNS